MSHDQTIDTLNDLIETCKDGEFGFQASADHVQSQELRNLFTARALECRNAAAELQTCVSRLGGRPEQDGSTSGAVHRGWVAVRGTLSGYTDVAMLEECERGEDVAKARYAKALKNDDLPEPVREIVERQYQGVLHNHDQVRQWRDRLRATV